MSKLRDISEQLNTSTSTVSRALRNDPRISQDMRDRVMSLAREMNYRPDAVISNLMRQIRSGEHYVQESIAVWWPGKWTRQALLEKHSNMRPVVESIRRTAQSLRMGLSFKDELIESSSAQSFARVARARGIVGLILLPGDPEAYSCPEAFKSFFCVGIGHAVEGELSARVLINFEEAYVSIFQQLSKRGYRRPAVLLREAKDKYYEMRLMGVYSYYTKNLNSFQPIPCLDLGQFKRKEWCRKILYWVKKTQPDAIVSPHHEVYDYLKNDGYFDQEKQMGYVSTSPPVDCSKLSGPVVHGQVMGKEAVFALRSGLHEAGFYHSIHIMVKTHWSEGETLPAFREREMC